jgi:hypothetical protein
MISRLRQYTYGFEGQNVMLELLEANLYYYVHKFIGRIARGKAFFHFLFNAHTYIYL